MACFVNSPFGLLPLNWGYEAVPKFFLKGKKVIKGVYEFTRYSSRYRTGLVQL